MPDFPTEPGLALYHYYGCYACRRVSLVLERLGVLLEERNVLEDPRHRSDLREATGRTRVPVLRIEDVPGEVQWLPESRDIVAFLDKRFGPAGGDADTANGTASAPRAWWRR